MALRRNDIVKIGLSRIVPVKSIALLAGEIGYGYIGVVVPKLNVLSATLVHVNVTQLPQAIDGLVVGQAEHLLNAVLALVGFILACFQAGLGVGKQQFPILRKEAYFAGLLVQLNREKARLNVYNFAVFLYLYVLCLPRLQHNRIALLLNGGTLVGVTFHDTDDGGRIELNGYVLLGNLAGHHLGRDALAKACHLYAFGGELAGNANSCNAQEGHEG